jgi:beta-lactamase regulating signal transducer with metallopeptidase domain
MTLLLSYALKSFVLLLVALAGVRLFRRRSAAFRHALLSAGVLAAEAVPLLTIVLPARDISMPAPMSVLPASEEEVTSVSDSSNSGVYPMVETSAADTPAVAAPSQSDLPPIDASRLLFVIWIAGTGILLVHLLAGVVRLFRFRTKPLARRTLRVGIDETFPYLT